MQNGIIENLKARVARIVEQYEEGLITEKEALGGVVNYAAEEWGKLDDQEACTTQAL
jgi:hypothetical protein